MAFGYFQVICIYQLFGVFRPFVFELSIFAPVLMAKHVFFPPKNNVCYLKRNRSQPNLSALKLIRQRPNYSLPVSDKYTVDGKVS